MTKQSLVLALVFGFTLSAAAQEGLPLFRTDFPPEEFAKRRAAVMDKIGESALALIQGAPSRSGFGRFRQSNEFYYLCGLEVPHSYLVLDGDARRAYLYLPHRNERRESSEGKMLSAEDANLLKSLTAVERIHPVEMLAEHLALWADRSQGFTIYTPLAPAEYMGDSRDTNYRTLADAASDPWDGAPSREGRLIRLLRERFPGFEIKNLSPILDDLRLIKSQLEQEMIRKATRLSGLAIMEAMRSTEPGIYEYELDAVLQFVYRRHGTQGDAYYPLICSGPNAWYPHYHALSRRMQDGELVLLDHAPDLGYYVSDLTRTWPVNGRFDNDQRDLYEFYLGCYKAILGKIRPGASPADIMAKAAVEMEKILAESQFSKDIYAEAAAGFVENYKRQSQSGYASLGHWVGMAVHDVGDYSGPLKPGMVFTIEPALRVPEERLYIRCEDLIIITENGAEIVSDFLPLEADDIESLMKEEGMLQRYPRDELFRE
jgi:Xaa-Pro aminopeptidase